MKLKYTATGSYSSYYTRRSNAPRLSVLRQHARTILHGAAVIDIGCNDGSLTAAISEEFGTASMLGVDIDAGLIESAVKRFGGTSRLRFQLGEWGKQNAMDGLDSQRGVFDVVTCFSVTKWIHLQHGDVGILRLFRQVQHALKPGGVFILEPQPMKSYRKVYCLSEAMRARYRAMQLDPASFIPFLTCGALQPGFELRGVYSAQGSSRKVFVLQKRSPGPAVGAARL